MTNAQRRRLAKAHAKALRIGPPEYRAQREQQVQRGARWTQGMSRGQRRRAGLR